MKNNKHRKIKIDIIEGKYKCISAYKIPTDVEQWLPCPNCGLKPLVWEFNNGRSTACGCGRNEYDHFSIIAESVLSVIERDSGSAMEYDINELKENWNYWVKNNKEKLTKQQLLDKGRW